MDPLIIAETNGEGRGIVLVGNSRPFQPLDLGVEQRITTDYYAGNPVAFQRITGPTFTNTTITGRWDDKKMRDADRPTLLGFGAVLATQGQSTSAAPGQIEATAGAPGGSKANNTYEIHTAIEAMALAGSRLRVSWGPHVRFGRIKRYVPSWRNRYHCEWEIEFEWKGSQEDQPVPQTPLPNVAGFGANLTKWITLITTQVDFLAGQPTLRIIDTAIGDLNAIAADVIADLGLVTDTVLAPAESLASVRSSYERLRVQCQAILDELEGNTPGVEEARQRDVVGGGIAAATARVVQRYLEILMEESMLRQAEINATLEKNQLDTYVVPDYMSLRQVAVIYYGSPDNWRAIAAHNNITSSVVEPGQEISIPKLV